MAFLDSILLHSIISINLGNAYHLTLSLMEYPNASHYCQNYCDSELASIHSQAQMEEAVELITRNGFVSREVWIGLHDNTIENSWQWQDGSVFDYGNTVDETGYIARGVYPWRSNEPDTNSTDNFVAIEATRNNEWTDKRHWYNYHFMCDSCSGSLERYVAINGYRDFAAAQQECEDRYQTSLASIHSIWDMYEAVNHCQGVAFNPTGAGCWLGLQNEGDESYYSWYDGMDWTYGTDTTTYPWSMSGPNEGDCVEMDAGDNYLWRRTSCVNTTARTLCNKPSEICNDAQWFILPGDSLWTTTKKPCLVSSNFVAGTSGMALIGDKQWHNEDNLLKVELTFVVDKVGLSGSAGVVMFIDGQCGDYYYVGVWAEYDTLFFGKFVDDQWTLIADAAMDSSFDHNLHYALQVEVYKGTEWTVALNTKLMLNNVTDDSFGNRGNTKSGHIGIRNVNASLTVHSLFVSGNIQYEDDLDFYYKCVPPTEQPAAKPTISPTTPTQSPVPTAPPTKDPSGSDTTKAAGTPPTPTSQPTQEPTYLFPPLDIDPPNANDAAMTQSEGGKGWLLIAMAVILVMLSMSVLFCYRQWGKHKVECFEGGPGLNQRKQTGDHSEDEDEENHITEFDDSPVDEQEVLTVEMTPEPDEEL